MIQPPLKTLIKYIEVVGERSLGREISLQVDITSMRNTVNPWSIKPEISNISVFHNPRNPAKEDSEVCLVWFFLTKVPEMDTQLSSLRFENAPFKCHEHSVKNRGGWDYLAKRWSQGKGVSPSPPPSPTHTAEYPLKRRSSRKSWVIPRLSSCYVPVYTVSWLFHITLGAEMITLTRVTTELRTVPGVWCALGRHALHKRWGKEEGHEDSDIYKWNVLALDGFRFLN